MLEGKVALVTGASRGIGKDIALRFAQEGAAIVFTHVTPSAAAEQTEQLCECSEYLAKKYLNLFVEEGRLRALGRKNSRFYAPAPEGF